ncbi:MAG TPA: 2-oxoglutarate dehydrogenase, E2 component, dihydrolipoamide succinyltransferase, partial [Solirubrobacterales bacterium]|nr:2-oxoglutarate dehydrogenase, E2 component, dihydrolipoamide succinyltransferase [Solirubrobacterales bacterium]
ESFQMSVTVTMPRLGESVTEGTVTRWLKQEGDTVEVDEPLLEVSTDKVDTEIPSPAAGVLTRIVVHEDETAEVGAELAVIGDSADDSGGSAEQPSAQEAPAEEAQEEPSEEPSEQPAAEETEPEPAAEESSEPAAEEPAPASGGEGTSVKMPALGESVTEGTVTRWLKQVGDSVDVDEPLLEVSTDKVDTEIPSPVAGTLLEIKVNEDETVEVGAVLATIGAAGSAPAAEKPASEKPAREKPAENEELAEKTAAEKSGQEKSAPEKTAAEKAEPKPEPEPAAKQEAAKPEATASTGPTIEASADRVEPAQKSGNGKVDGDESAAGYVTPLVRKLAAENNVNLAELTGTGIGGRIRKQDVLDAAARQKEAAAKPAAAPAEKPAPEKPKPTPSPLRGRTEKLSRMRALIARRMVESLQISAQLTTVVEVDVTKIARLRDKAKAKFQETHGVKLSFLPFFALAAVEALRVHPNVNASIDVEAGTVTYHDAEHLGMAVDSERGLTVPVIHNAGDLNLAGLARRIADVAERTRANKLTPDEISGGTFTLTNTGSRGALFDTPIINQPQVAILGTGAVVKRAVVVNDPDLGEVIAPRSMVYLALSYDHRLVDGADAARFLGTIKERLEGGNFDAEVGL